MPASWLRFTIWPRILLASSTSQTGPCPRRISRNGSPIGSRKQLKHLESRCRLRKWPRREFAPYSTP